MSVKKHPVPYILSTRSVYNKTNRRFELSLGRPPSSQWLIFGAVTPLALMRALVMTSVVLRRVRNRLSIIIIIINGIVVPVVLLTDGLTRSGMTTTYHLRISGGVLSVVVITERRYGPCWLSDDNSNNICSNGWASMKKVQQICFFKLAKATSQNCRENDFMGKWCYFIFWR